MGHHGAPRLPSFSYRGFCAYSVTCCTFGRHTWFTEAQCVSAVREHLLQLAAIHAFDVSAYCFIPDHLHFLVEATSPESEFRRLMNVWKQKTGYAHKRRTRSRLWQNGYYEHVLRQDDDRVRVIAYLVANPLRAGLVEDIRQYPYWGSGMWEREQVLDSIQHLITEGRRAG